MKDKVHTYDGKKVIPDVNVLQTCSYHKGSCELLNELIVWDNRVLGEVCPYTFKGNYIGYKGGNHFIIDDLQAAFKTHLIDYKICSGLTPLLYEGQGVILKQINIEKYRNMKRSIDPINGKLNYLEYRIIQAEKD